jgi:hypothetical protein
MRDEKNLHLLHFFTKHANVMTHGKSWVRKPLFFKEHRPYNFGDICSVIHDRYDTPHPQSESGITMQTQRKPAKSRSPRTSRAPRPEYIAAVRYPEGHSEIFHVRNADNFADARELVILEVGDVQSIMIALRH